MRYSLIILLMLTALLQAQIPEGYYDGTEELSGDDLKTALHEIIKDHVEFPYTSSGTDVWDILKVTDRDPNNAENVILIYTGWSVNAAQEYNNGTGWSREHIWAKSHGDFGTAMGPGTDAHHLRPCDISVNSARGNKDFDAGGTQYIDPQGGATGCYATTYTWEPRDAVKGDVARMIFYMAVRYEGDSGEPDLEIVDYAPSAPALQPLLGVFSTLYEWHLADPVDEWEENRNDIIYYDYQGNRNPFIDHPEFAALVWNVSSIQNNVITPDTIILTNYPNPFNPSTTINFGVTQSSAFATLEIYNIKGQRVKTFSNHQITQSPNHQIVWDGRDENNIPVASGTYIYQFRTKDFQKSAKMLLLK